MPWTRTRAYPHAFAVPNNKAGGNYNYMSYVIFDQMFWRASSSRSTVGARRCWASSRPTLTGSSSTRCRSSTTLVPAWFLGRWTGTSGSTSRGFWFLDNPDNSSSKEVGAARGAGDVHSPARASGSASWCTSAGAPSLCRRRGHDEVCAAGGAQERRVRDSVRLVGSAVGDASKRSAALDPAVAEDVFQVSSVPHDWLFRKSTRMPPWRRGHARRQSACGLPTVVKPYLATSSFGAADREPRRGQLRAPAHGGQSGRGADHRHHQRQADRARAQAWRADPRRRRHRQCGQGDLPRSGLCAQPRQARYAYRVRRPRCATSREHGSRPSCERVSSATTGAGTHASQGF